MGSVGKITQPFTELSSAPAKLIGNGISWKNEFTGVAGEFVSSIEPVRGNRNELHRFVERPDPGKQYRLRNRRAESLYGFSPGGCGPRASEGYLAAQEAGDKRLVLNHAASDAGGKSHAGRKGSRWRLLRFIQQLQRQQHGNGPGPGFRDDHPGQPDGGDGSTHGVPSGEGSGGSLRTGDRPEGSPGPAVAGRSGSADPLDEQIAGIEARRASMQDGLLFRIPALYGGGQ